MTNVSFEDQRKIFRQELFKAFDYVDYEKYMVAKIALSNGDWNDKNLHEIMLKASYNGNLIRIAYYKYVHKHGFDARALMDAIVLEYVMQGVFLFNFENLLRDADVKKAINVTRWPEWTKFGLIGGSTTELIKLGDKFSEYMDGLEASEWLTTN
jgi:hypothetical protein